MSHPVDPDRDRNAVLYILGHTLRAHYQAHMRASKGARRYRDLPRHHQRRSPSVQACITADRAASPRARRPAYRRAAAPPRQHCRDRDRARRFRPQAAPECRARRPSGRATRTAPALSPRGRPQSSSRPRRQADPAETQHRSPDPRPFDTVILDNCSRSYSCSPHVERYD